MIFLIVMFLVFFILMVCIKPKCPDCNGKMDDIDLYDDHMVYKCKNCGKEWI